MANPYTFRLVKGSELTWEELDANFSGSIYSASLSGNTLTLTKGDDSTLEINIGTIEGSQGSQGPQGPQGNQGFKGDPGDPGSTGPQGNQGNQGPQGPQGNQGRQGPLPDTSLFITNSQTGSFLNSGSFNSGTSTITLYSDDTNYTLDLSSLAGGGGSQGPQGPQGNQGPQGPQGNQGFKGDQGDIGLTGPQGDPGDPGSTGPQGNQGNQGPQGPQGNQGYQGPQGNQGFKGDQGDIGLTGPQGDPGDPGSTGPQGPQGNQGPQGPQGNQGFKGDQGDVGLTGPQGDPGDPGSTGPQGNQGNQGPQGPQGNQGSQGRQGPSPDTSLFITNSQTGSFLISASVDSNTIYFTASNASTFSITVDTGSGGGGVTINNNTDNYVITATGTSNTLNGEANMTFDGNNLRVTHSVFIQGNTSGESGIGGLHLNTASLYYNSIVTPGVSTTNTLTDLVVTNLDTLATYSFANPNLETGRIFILRNWNTPYDATVGELYVTSSLPSTVFGLLGNPSASFSFTMTGSSAVTLMFVSGGYSVGGDGGFTVDLLLQISGDRIGSGQINDANVADLIG